MSEHAKKQLKKVQPAPVNKNLLLLFLLVFIVAALVLVPSFNHNVASGISAINSKTANSAASVSQFSTIYDTLKYERSIHVLAMLLVGFGFLMVFVRNHGYSSITATFLVVSIAIPMYTDLC